MSTIKQVGIGKYLPNIVNLHDLFLQVTSPDKTGKFLEFTQSGWADIIKNGTYRIATENGYTKSIDEFWTELVAQIGIGDVTAETIPTKNPNITIQSALDTLSTNLSNEISRATTAESTNAQSIIDEVTRATGIENGLDTKINTEAQRAKTIEEGLDARITALENK